jgi:hypothetical protein
MKLLKLLNLIPLILLVSVINAQVGIGVSTPNASAQLEVSATNKGFLPPRMDSTARNAIASPAIGLTIYNTSSKAFECYNGTGWYSTVHYVGETYGGGIVFYVYDNGQHGLIASTSDQSITGVQWYNGTFRYTGAQGDGIGSGSMNTTMIVAAQLPDNTSGVYAAKLCAQYAVTVNGITYGGWYLPSKEELNLLYLNQNIVGGLDITKDYWSSTEFGSNTAYYQFFGNGTQGNDPKSNTSGYVRAIRAF